MRIYSEVVIDVASGEVICAKVFDYTGPIAHCGGGGKSSPRVEPAPPAPEPAKRPATATQATRDLAQQRAIAAAGLSATRRTGAMGLSTEATTTKKKLMGS